MGIAGSIARHHLSVLAAVLVVSANPLAVAADGVAPGTQFTPLAASVLTDPTPVLGTDRVFHLGLRAAAVDSLDRLPDQHPPEPPPIPPIHDTLGNHVTIKVGPGPFLLYGHLQPGSVRVRRGRSVRRGQVLGLIGTSGNSTTPHLHFQVITTPTFFPTDSPPFRFNRFDLVGVGHRAHLGRQHRPAAHGAAPLRARGNPGGDGARYRSTGTWSASLLPAEPSQLRTFNNPARNQRKPRALRNLPRLPVPARAGRAAAFSPRSSNAPSWPRRSATTTYGSPSSTSPPTASPATRSCSPVTWPRAPAACSIGTAVVNLTFTHPLRFVERVALLDHATGGRVEVGVGRGYQFPQYGVFGVPIDETRAIFDESLDVVLRAWDGDESPHEGRYFPIPPVRMWPLPMRAPAEVLLHAVEQPGEHAAVDRTRACRR